MNFSTDQLQPEWKWATAEGSRQFDRQVDRRLTLWEILEWQEEAENLTLQLEQARKRLGNEFKSR